MNEPSIFEVALTILASVGTGGAIVFGLSAWLGKLWATRLMQKEMAEHSRALEHLRIQLQTQLNRSERTFLEKVELYKQVSKPVIELADGAHNCGTITEEMYRKFDCARLESAALLALFAPAEVFEMYNTLVDWIFDVVEGKERWSFPAFRERTLKVLTLMRKDIGLYGDDLQYYGHR